jgi:hypothetical protein
MNRSVTVGLFVDALARPGGNATGFILFEYSLGGKWLELLKQIAPGVTRAAVIRDGPRARARVCAWRGSHLLHVMRLTRRRGSYRHWRHTHTGRTSFDHLVGEAKQCRRHGKAQGLRGR